MKGLREKHTGGADKLFFLDRTTQIAMVKNNNFLAI